MSVNLPIAAHEYFTAASAGDIERTVAVFADDAAVMDEGVEIRGRSAIRGWVERTTQQYGATATPDGLDGSGGVATITAVVSGRFPGSPVRLTYRFQIERDQIVRLEIH